MTEPRLERVAFPVLVGDIGGTNARFALLADTDAPLDRIPDLATGALPTVADAIEDVLAGRDGPGPKTAMLALAGPIAGDRVSLTNSDWVVEPKVLIERFGLDEVILFNDFEALSLSLPGLAEADIDPIGGGTATPTGPRVVVGPGTGLGAGALVHARDMWVPIPGEGGHVDLGPVTARDFAIWPHIERTFGRMSAETIICGSGLVRLYRGIGAADGTPAPLDTPAAITSAGLSDSDPVAAEALRLFAVYLGRLAGDLALVFAARGGVYLAGGITARIAPVLKSGVFREAFVAKGPHDEWIDGMATAIITRPDAALSGIAAFARMPSRFGVDLAGRRWWR